MRVHVTNSKQMLWHTLIFLFLLLAAFLIATRGAEFPIGSAAPTPPEMAWQYSQFRTGPFEVAKIFGRSTGCLDASIEFVQLVNDSAVRVGLDPRIAAATIAIESNCDVMAVSNRGAIGAMQIHVKTWSHEYDFTKINLLNPRDNIRVGTRILSDLIFNYGVQEGLHRYNGLGTVGGDPQYTEKILRMTGRR